MRFSNSKCYKSGLFRNRSVILLYLTIAFTFSLVDNLFAQNEEVKVFDRFGKTHSFEEIRLPEAGQTANGSAVSCAAGFFNLVFSDPFGYGFNNPPAGSVYRDVACRVFTDLSQLIVPANNPYTGLPNAMPIVNINLHAASGGGAIAGQATSYYNEVYVTSLYNNTTYNGFVEGEVWKTINGGVDSYTAFENYYTIGQYYHGDVVINFAPSFTWNLDYSIPTPVGTVDLYTVMIHEAIHMLGFASLISSNGSSNLPQTDFYTRFDSHLFIDSSGTMVPIISNSNPGNCGTVSYSGANFVSGCNTRFVGTNNEPVTPALPFSSGQSLFHFEEGCFPNTPYVMANGGSPGTTRRHPTQEDVDALCDLNYHTTNTYGVAGTGFDNFSNSYNACGSAIAGVDDIFYNGTHDLYQYTDCAGQLPITISDFLSNDYDQSGTNGRPFSFDCLTILIGSGVISNSSSTSFDFNTVPGYNGWTVLRYVPISSNGNRGNLTYIYILTVPCSDCNVFCNQVEFGDFEEINNRSVLPTSNFTVTQNNSPDLFGWNGTAWVVNPVSNWSQTTWGITCNSSTINVPPSWSGLPNARYAGFVGLQTMNEEGMTFKLCSPLVAGVQYTLSFYSTVGALSCPAEVLFYASEFAPCFPGVKHTDFSGPNNCYSNSPTFYFTLIGSQVINSLAPTWTKYTFNFVYNPVSGSNDANYLTLSITPQNFPTFPYIFVDDIYLKCETQDVSAENERSFLSIKPNPSRDIFQMHLENVSNGKLTVSLSNTLGQIIKSDDFIVSGNAFNTRIDLTEFPSGVFFLNVHSEKENRVVQLIKQ
jgi:hypothetical protein